MHVPYRMLNIKAELGAVSTIPTHEDDKTMGPIHRLFVL